ncbi:NUDIX domain-containing protein [Streptomyces sulphureus]|uniref:NUDIX domain-containing protein n=1 Tax=Streptomyces sulphureus TaxID=47758 RepID=UPI00037A6FBD|nr:NUDIX domain-containing protein [Streptomyces sulphureus]
MQDDPDVPTRRHLPSGKLDAAEPLTAGAARALREETGIIEYPAAGLRGYLAGRGSLTEHGW